MAKMAMKATDGDGKIVGGEPVDVNSRAGFRRPRCALGYNAARYGHVAKW
jgi:hypothetical protein